jgi:chaperonin GroES
MSNCCIRPLNKRLAVRRFAPKGKTEGGLFIPEGAKELSVGGEVLAVGRGVEDIQPGDAVLFNAHAGVEVCIEGTNILMLKYEDVLGVSSK